MGSPHAKTHVEHRAGSTSVTRQDTNFVLCLSSFCLDYISYKKVEYMLPSHTKTYKIFMICFHTGS